MATTLTTEIYPLNAFASPSDVKAKLASLGSVRTTITGHFAVAKELVDGAKKTLRDGIQLVNATVIEAKSQWFLVSMDDLSEAETPNEDGTSAPEEIERQFWIRPLTFAEGTENEAVISFEFDPTAIPVAKTVESNEDEAGEASGKPKRARKERKPRKSRRGKPDGDDAEAALGSDELEADDSQINMFDVDEDEEPSDDEE